MFGLSLLLISFVSAVLLVILAFEIWMFVDAIRNSKLSDNEKLLWCIGMIFFHPVIAIVYYFVAYSARSK